jgi:thiamine biosynthesis lipoprotein
MNKPSHGHSLPMTDKENPSGHPLPTLSERNNSLQLTFKAMASDCTILLEHTDLPPSTIANLCRQAVAEAWRIEHKYSRYRFDNQWFHLHQHPGEWQTLDHETAMLMSFAHQAWSLSNGLFDITSGLLRRVWKFDGSDNIPTRMQVESLLPDIGWQKLFWNPKQPEQLKLPQGMELDFGGIGKEYAVDRILATLMDMQPSTPFAVLVNCGGDLSCSGPRLNGQPWTIGIENHQQPQSAAANIELSAGALATSGDSKRFLLKDGVRYSHVLNPKSGWPIMNAPHSVTVAAPSCINAGILATLALLQGSGASAFLADCNVPYWIESGVQPD